MPFYRGAAPVVREYVGAVPVLRRYRGTALVADYAPATPTPVPATVRAFTSVTMPNPASPVAVGKPAGTAAGDLLVLFAAQDTGASTALVLPAGFTELARLPAGTGTDKRVVVGYKVAGSAEPASYPVGAEATSDGRVDLLAISGADTSKAPTVATSTTATSLTSHTAPTVTPPASSARNLSLYAMVKDDNTAARTWTWSTAVSGVSKITDAHSRGWLTQAVFQQRWDASTATGTRAFSVATSSGATATSALMVSVVVASGTTGTAPPPSPGYTPNATAGTGGAKSDLRAQSFTNGTRTSPYHISAGHLAGSGPWPLVLHLHGDGYQEYTHMAQGVAGSAAFAYEQAARDAGALFVLPRTPDTTSETWYTAAYATTWLIALLDDVKSRYNVDLNRVFLSGFSGGAEQITYTMLADHSAQFTGGGAMILGGGGADGLAFGAQPTAALKSRFPMRWFVGENDVAGATQPPDWSARDAAAGGEAFYRAAGFTRTSVTIIPGKAHDDSEPSGPGYLRQVITESNALYGI